MTMTNNAAINIADHLFLWYDWASFGSIPKSGIAGSWVRLFPKYLKNHHTDSQSSYTSLHSHQQGRSAPFTLQPLYDKLLLVFLILAILKVLRWNLTVVLICISLMAKDVEHFLKCPSVMLDLLLRVLCLGLYPFFIGLLFWWQVSWVLCIFGDQALSDVWNNLRSIVISSLKLLWSVQKHFL